MTTQHKTHAEREYPHTHLIHILAPCIMIVLGLLDLFVFKIIERYLSILSWYIRIPLFIVIQAISLMFIIRANKALFRSETHEPPDHVITSGVFAYTRNPLYLGMLLSYLSFIVLTLSILAFGVWIVVVFIYDKMVTYDEKILEELFGEEYQEYKHKTPKWIIFR